MTEGIRTALLQECANFYTTVIAKLPPERARAVAGCPWSVQVQLEPLAIGAYAVIELDVVQPVYRGPADRIPPRLLALVNTFAEMAHVELLADAGNLSVLVDASTSTIGLYCDGRSDPALFLRPPIRPKAPVSENDEAALQ